MAPQRHNEGFSLWQSFSDLAMGLMAVFTLILVLLLTETQDERDSAERETEQLIEELIKLLESSVDMIEEQEGVVRWINSVFEKDDCQLRLHNGRLVPAGSQDNQATQLYDLGSVRLSKTAREALSKCVVNFEILTVCLGNSDQSKERCLDLVHQVELADEKNLKLVNQYRSGIEALILQGNTDQISLKSRYIQPIWAVEKTSGKLAPLSQRFVDNAYLGSERARQALGHLLGVVQANNPEDDGILDLIMAKMRIESPSFGLFQAGPIQGREGLCPLAGECEEARNLSLLIRWRTEALRKPFDVFREKLCKVLGEEGSKLADALQKDGGRYEKYKGLCR